MKKLSNKHEFALYWSNLSYALEHDQQKLALVDQLIVHRIFHVLRLQKGESIILFDQNKHALCLIEEINKKNCILSIKSYLKNVTLDPSISFLLPLLKREALETLIYSLVELGVNKIQLIKTAKTQRSWENQADYERLQKIIIAASEQSKNYAFPNLYPPCTIEQAFEMLNPSAIKLYADPHGISLQELIANLDKKRYPTVLMIGPEGDLNDEEKSLLRTQHFTFCSLTPTILRSIQAGAILAGFIRSFYK